MTGSIEYIAEKTQLEQTVTFKAEYENSFGLKPSSQLFSFFTGFKDVAEVFNEILISYEKLTNYQKEILRAFFVAFNDLRAVIDPQRLESFKYEFNADDELVLYRNSGNALINIIINPDECFALSIIPKNLNNAKSLTFYEEDYSDFEGLAYKFFS